MKNNLSYQKKIIWLIWILCIFCHCYLPGNQNIQEVLNRIPIEDREALHGLFRSLFNGEHFSYTLFGDKPMSLGFYSTTLFDEDEIFSQKALRFRKKWEIWKKYAHLFPMQHYLLIENPSNRKGIIDIYFINKNLFINLVNRHLESFQNVFGSKITGTVLLQEIEKNSRLLSNFDTNQTLLGILLGYGEHNARLYDKRDQISFFVWKKEFPKIPIKIATPSEGFSSLQEEFNAYFPILTIFGDLGYSPLLISPVHFVADHSHPETGKLQEKYRKMRGDISAIYAQGDFLEITLLKLME